MIFDGTIHDSHHPIPGKVMGPPMPGAKEALERLFAEGHEIIIFTAREEVRHHIVMQWLEDWNIPYHFITNVKPQHVDWFIDNRAIHFDNWDDALYDLEEYGNYK